MSENQVNAIKTPAACMKTVSEDRVQLCGHIKSIRFLNEDGVSRQSKPSVSIQSKDGVLRQGKAGRQHPKQRRSPKTGVWQRFQGDGNVSRCYSTGHPRVTTPNEDRYLAVTAKRNRRGTASDLYRQLSSATGTTVSRQTVYRRLGHIGL
ncbi:HTH_Tnp_Tc3_2 domain-containing protein [Trichonephila clavipes]|nr:HTH_Tnp_Tc3_2 domain-containing protein [Trichonephila clavipes]